MSGNVKIVLAIKRIPIYIIKQKLALRKQTLLIIEFDQYRVKVKSELMSK
jgi:hypothetical protein